MTRLVVLCIAIVALGWCAAASSRAGEEASFGGMVVTHLTEGELAAVEKAYGERCGVGVKRVIPGSLAARTGIASGDILLSVRMPEDDDFYPIPPDGDDMARFCAEEQSRASTSVRLLLLRKSAGAWTVVACHLGVPLSMQDAPPRESEATPTEQASGRVESARFDFQSNDPHHVLARSPTGDTLRQMDVDLYGGVIAWSFGARLTEGQKAVIRRTLVEYWPSAPATEVQAYRTGVGVLPQRLPRMTPAEREQVRLHFAREFAAWATRAPTHPIAGVVLVVSANVRTILAGAGTPTELSQQDVDALLEYLAFTTWIQTGLQVVVSPAAREAFQRLVIARFEAAGESEKLRLASMDQAWGQMRAQWAAAQAAQQQALTQRWQQAYARQGNAAGPAYPAGWYSPAPGGGMSASSFDAVLNSMNATHDASMQALGAIDGGYDTSTYDSAGNWLYDS